MQDNRHILTPALDHIPPGLVSLGDYERLAQTMIRPDIWEYLDSGVADEITLKRNRSAFDAISLRPQLLQRFDNASTRTQLLGKPLQHPLLLAPVAHQRLLHPQGELATARGAAVMDTPMLVSTLSSIRLEDIAASGHPNLWFQLYWQHNRTNSLHLLQRAEDGGYQALVITLDAPVNGLRNRTQRSGFCLPEGVNEANLLNLPQPQPRTLTADQSLILNGIMSDAPTLDDLLWLQSQTRLPVLIKGVITPEDAQFLKHQGFAGLIVSNHGGRTLDGLPATIEALPAIRAAVGADYPLLLDSGIRRGTDVVKALALGANAVLIGRPQLHALAVAGALGVAHMLKLLRDELEISMALAGCPRIDTIGTKTVILT
jgi:4-hydroxymandelate oxidase